MGNADRKKNTKNVRLTSPLSYPFLHSMATANLNKSEDFVTNTTAASKYIPRRNQHELKSHLSDLTS
jgi:hypothetical protein